MDPFTIALAVFGVSKLTGSSTKSALRNAFLAGTGSAAFGASGLGGTEGFLSTVGKGDAFSGITSLLSAAPTAPGPDQALTSAGYTTSAPVSEEIASQTFGGAGKIVNPPTVPYTAPNIFERGITAFQNADTATKLGIGAAGVTLAGSLGEDEDPMKRPPGMSDEDYARAMEEARLQVKDIGRRAPQQTASTTSPYNYGKGSLYTFNQGGIVSMMPKYSIGGINYLPSKVTHDENDLNNYVRASGYVEDGSGNGNKDEDTILAQLADGEFVSRSDAILGAGILEGANPNNYKDMRKKGAAYFYDQQAKFKRIFDLIDASKQVN